MLYLVPYFAGLFIMLASRLWIQHRHKQYYLYIIYMTLVLTGAYGFSRSLLADQGFVYIFILTIGMALFAAYITRTSLVEEPTEAK
ncbi:MAG TPA: hypothetical protein VGE66_10270 [Chitinophagaceae bacterium]